MRREILEEVDPHRRWERDWQEMERVIRACPFSLYGLDASWKGLRRLSAHGGRLGQTHSVELAHGDPEEQGSGVRVETALSRVPSDADPFLVAHELWSRVERPPAGLPPHLRGVWMQRRFEEHRAREALDKGIDPR